MPVRVYETAKNSTDEKGNESTENGKAPFVKVIYGEESGIVLSGLKDEHRTLIKAAIDGASPISDLLTVYVGIPEDDSRSMLGSVSINDSDVVFKPRFALSRKVDYTIRIQLPAMDSISVVKRDHYVRADTDSSLGKTKVSAVYPSQDLLPDNLLKLYVHFSKPMSRGDVYDQIELIDRATNSVIEMPFLEIEQELWNADQTRLTILFDPGRIKRGLMPREQFGPPLNLGGKYKFRVLETWKDADGQPLDDSFEKTFEVVESDQSQPRTSAWRVSNPKAGTREPLTIDFAEALDRAMLSHAISILSHGELVAGSIEVNKKEAGLAFTPDKDWTSDKHTIRVDNRLEDLAGNSIGRAFEVNDENSAQVSSEEFSHLPFTPVASKTIFDEE